ncbi:tetrathionate reductase subunit B precursor [bacterium BMS3Abin05]|nr:tetrathionate reductase subunit B precursor [bacterium BMS3Abin05]GBE28044.1 tetrathionate reductase subunit B precursor [bacterium BMS3Bbin03]HDZ13159.1 4Fe-4S dicluster domain-containing protein [Bacteroidota bacterium]
MVSEYRLIRMQKDLARSLKKPAAKRSWIMLIDVDKCIGCRACQVSCKAENVSPPGVTYRVVKEVEDGEYPNVNRIFMPTNCQQCDNPPCIKGLPEDAYTKREDGILVFHYEKMKGEKIFKKVQSQCPYTAVYRDTGAFYTANTPELEPYETRICYEYGKEWVRKGAGLSPIGAVRKCHFCLHRLESEMLPACVSTCVGGAMYFGDKNDSQSLVNELQKKRQTLRINESEGTEPRVIYLTGTIASVSVCAKCHG